MNQDAEWSGLEKLIKGIIIAVLVIVGIFVLNPAGGVVTLPAK